ncbi:F-box family protein [Trifolium medium]|uniref:F-box family protein n=1 Tax=Trifolium medium TaxID=97028 RepID=A0A392PXH1_9FABA|nr:F-box family protein [Trifolium medium]
MWFKGLCNYDGIYTVKASYNFLATNFLPPLGLNAEECSSLYKVWDSYAPLKVIIFNWQLLRHRLPTRSNLMRRCILPSVPGVNCCWCSSFQETEKHLFATCRVAAAVWAEVYNWMGLTTVLLGNLFTSFDTFGFPFKCKKHLKGLNMIWQVVTWRLWMARNVLIFDGKKTTVCDIVEVVKSIHNGDTYF